MSFSISPNMGPRGLLQDFGQESKHGAPFDRKVISGMLKYLVPYRIQMFWAALLMIVVTSLTLIGPYLIKIAIDQNILGSDLNGLNQTALLILAVYVGLYLSSAGQQYILSWVGQRVLGNLRAIMFRHLQRLSMSYHTQTITGVTVSRVINDVAVINDLLTQGLISILSDVLILIGILVVMLTMSPKLALITFIVIPLMVLATHIFSTHARTAFRQTRRSIASLVANLAENNDTIRVIQAFAQEKIALERFKKVNDANRDANIEAIRLSFIFLPSIEFLGILAIAIVLWFGGLLVIQGEVTIGILVAFIAYVTRFFDPVQELSRIYTTMQSAMAGGEQVLKLLSTEPDLTDKPDAIELGDVSGEIELADVGFWYPSRGEGPEEVVIVLDDINLKINPGQTIAVVGATGAGKTTIAYLVARYYDVKEGAVRIDNYDVRDLMVNSLRRQIGYVPQDPVLFAGTIADNIRFGRPEATQEMVEHAARLANVHDFVLDFPDGYDTWVLEGAVNLSVGQRQLICIARAALVSPHILILDEATASVDTVTEVMIQKALNRLLEGKTAIVIAHRLSTIRNANQICVVQNGRIVQQGKHEELFAVEGLYQDLYSRQFSMV